MSSPSLSIPADSDRYDVVVVGGGHAGTEAARAAAAALGAGGRVALVTMEPARLGQMRCNPAIGGLAKGQIVREIDALGGLMGLAADASGIQFKVLNSSKGPAVRGPRAQCDKYAYRAEIQRLLAGTSAIDVIAGTVDEILRDAEGAACGVRLPPGAQHVSAENAAIERNCVGDTLAQSVFTRALESPHCAPRTLFARAVVLTTGTFMRALMHTGDAKLEGGRIGEGSAKGISTALRALGFELGRLKTGTPPRGMRSSPRSATLCQRRSAILLQTHFLQRVFPILHRLIAAKPRRRLKSTRSYATTFRAHRCTRGKSTQSVVPATARRSKTRLCASPIATRIMSF